MTYKKTKQTKEDRERIESRARDQWDTTHQELDLLWSHLQENVHSDLQDERDAVCDALDALLAAGGVKES